MQNIRIYHGKDSRITQKYSVHDKYLVFEKNI